MGNFFQILALAGFVLFGVFVLMAAIYTFYESYREERRATQRKFEAVARRFGGNVIPVVNRLPSIRFRHKQFEALVDCEMTQSSNEMLPVYRFQIAWPDKSLRCDVAPRSWLHYVGRMFGVESIGTSDADFDAKFHVRGNDATNIRGILHARTREIIQELQTIEYNDQFYMSIQAGVLVVRKPGFLDQPELLQRFVRLCVELFDSALEGQPFAVAELAASELSFSTRSAVCPVCGEPLHGDKLFCSQCHTPHHRDCWEYVDGCATYGCRCKSAVTER